MIFVFLSLISFSMTISKSIHVAANCIISLFLWLSNIPCLLYPCLLYPFFYIHSYLGGHLGCFHILAIVNSTAMNIRVHVSFQIIPFLRVCAQE